MHNIDPNISIQLMKSTIWDAIYPFGQAASDVYTNNIYKKKSPKPFKLLLFVANRDSLIQRKISEDEQTPKNNNLKQASATTT